MNSTIKNTLELSVSELSDSIKNLIEDNFGFIRVKGEIGRVSKPASGHIYFDLKDKTQLSQELFGEEMHQLLKLNQKRV